MMMEDHIVVALVVDDVHDEVQQMKKQPWQLPRNSAQLV